MSKHNWRPGSMGERYIDHPIRSRRRHQNRQPYTVREKRRGRPAWEYRNGKCYKVWREE